MVQYCFTTATPLRSYIVITHIYGHIIMIDNKIEKTECEFVKDSKIAM